MATVVCCPCGNPIDCDHLELVVTLNCPRCEREFSIEVQHAKYQRCIGVLTVMEGPFWVGEQFVLPVGEDLILGKKGENWLSLESDELADIHCKLRLQPAGSVVVHDLGSDSGTWIGDARVLQGKLTPQDSFRIGEYRFRLDFRAAIGGESAVVKAAAIEHSGELPVLRRVQSKSPIAKIIKYRYQALRWFLLLFAVLDGLYHALALHFRQILSTDSWSLRWSIPAGLAVFAVISICGRRFTLAHRYLKFAALVVLVTLAVSDVIWTLQPAAIASLIMAAGLSLLIFQSGKDLFAFLGMLLGLIGLLIIAVAAIYSVSFAAAQ